MKTGREMVVSAASGALASWKCTPDALYICIHYRQSHAALHKPAHARTPTFVLRHVRVFVHADRMGKCRRRGKLFNSFWNGGWKLDRKLPKGRGREDYRQQRFQRNAAIPVSRRRTCKRLVTKTVTDSRDSGILGKHIHRTVSNFLIVFHFD